MTKNSITKTVLLGLVIVTFFNVAAYADTFPNFRLRIENTAGVGRVFTDNVKLGLGNLNGDQDTVNGTVYFAGYVGDVYVVINATSVRDNGFGEAVLTLGALVNYSGTGSGQIKITLEDTGYGPPSAGATFLGSVSGFDYATRTATPEGGASAGWSTAFQTWLNAANTVPAFGNNGNYSVAGSIGTLSTPVGTTAFDGGSAGETFTGAFASTTDSAPGPTSGNYAIVSQATVNFSGAGSSNFTLVGSDPLPDTPSVPEPTSLLLLGSGLLGLALLRRKKETAE